MKYFAVVSCVISMFFLVRGVYGETIVSPPLPVIKDQCIKIHIPTEWHVVHKDNLSAWQTASYNFQISKVTKKNGPSRLLTIEVLIYALTRAQRHGDLSGKTYKTFSGLRGILHTESFTAGKRDWYLTFPIQSTNGALIVRIVGVDESLPGQKGFVDSIFKNISFSTVSTPSVSSDKVTISVIHKGGYNFFVAKKGNKTLWKYDAWGTMFHDSYSGMSVLESANLLVVDRYGKVRKQLSIGAVESPQFLSLMHGNLIFEMGNLAPGVIVPKDWKLTAEWYRTVRRVCAYNVRSLHYLWSAGETDIGTPVSCNGRYLDTLRIVNFIQCLKNPQKTPIVAIDQIAVATGHRIHSAILSISRTDALSLKSCFLGGGANPPAHIIWNPTGVHVYGLFGGNYAGKIISARRKLKKRK